MGNCNEKEKLVDELAGNIGALYDNMEDLLPATNDLVDVINSIKNGNIHHISVSRQNSVQKNAEHFVELINVINRYIDVHAQHIKVRLQPDIFRELFIVTISYKEDTWPETIDELKEAVKDAQQCIKDLQTNTDKYITDIETIKVQLMMN